MAKQIVPHKLVINYDNNGDFRDGIYLYKLVIDGKWDGKFRSTTIKNFKFSKPQFNQMLKVVRDSVESVEKVKEE